MFSLNHKVSPSPALLLLASFALVSLLGMSMGMEMRDGQMSGCPFMTGEESMCRMSVTEHITQWQEAFLGIPTKTNFLALVVSLLAVVLIPSAKLFSKLERPAKFAAQLFARHKAYLVKAFDPLLLAFSDGILHPRIYNSANL